MKAKTTPVNEDLYDRLAKHFSDPDWWLVYEIGTWNDRDEGGDGKWRQADAVAISRWSARSYEFHGIEVKATRSDWLAELREPAKADPLIRLCRKWWVLAPAEVVRDSELPDGWGLLVPSGTGLAERVRAKPRPEVEEPTRGWWVRILRQLGEGKTFRKRLNAAYAAGERAGRQGSTFHVEQERNRALERVKEIEGGVAAFEKASGIKFNPWDAGDLGRAVRVVLETRGVIDRADNMASNVRRALEDLEKALREGEHAVPMPKRW